MFSVELLLLQELRGNKKADSWLFAVTEPTGSAPTKVEERPTKMQSETGLFFQMIDKINFIGSYDNS